MCVYDVLCLKLQSHISRMPTPYFYHRNSPLSDVLLHSGRHPVIPACPPTLVSFAS